MRILHVLPTFDPGGAERMVLDLATAQRSSGHEVAVASSGGAWRSRLDGVEHLTVPAFAALPVKLPAALREMRRILSSTRPDLVHAHVAGLGAAARLVSPRLGVVVTVHGLDPHEYDRAARILRWARLPAVAVSDVVASELQERGVRPPRLHRILNGASLHPADDSRVERLAARLEVGRDRPLLVGIGRLVAPKDWPTLVRAAALLGDVDLVIAGDGPVRDDLARLGRELGVRLHLPGFVDDVEALLQLSTVMVATSVREGASIAVLEAISLGTACVVTPVCTHDDLARSGAVVVVPAGAPEAVAEAIRPLLRDPDELEALRSRAREAADRYSVSRMVAEYEALVAAVANR